MNVDRLLQLAVRRAPAVVLQVSYANGLGVIRDLGRHGVPSLGVDPNPAALGFLSRYAAGITCPDPVDDETGFIDTLERVGSTLPQPGVIFPTHDEYVWTIAKHRGRLERYYRIPSSPWETLARIADKEQQLRTASSVGVDTPDTVFIRTAADLEEGRRRIPFPAIFKPVEGTAFKRRFGRQVLRVERPEELEEAWSRVQGCGTMMLQDIIPGGDEELYTVGSYLDARSRPLAVFTGRKLRQHPKHFGTSRFAEAVWIEDLAEAGLRLLAALGYHGVSQVEFKRDPRDGRYRLMEVNARHWLWHSLAAACGVNLSYVAYRDAIGDPFLAPRQIDGRRWILTLKDVLDSGREIGRGELTAAEWLCSLRGTRVDGVLSARDPVPGAVNVYRMGKRALLRRSQARPEIEL